MAEYRYVIVASDGRSWLLQGDQQYDNNADQNCVLPRLLADGWQPIRERSMGGQENTFALVLLKNLFAAGSDDIPF
jgi:hypothetical protein